jgi:hypothetical protein
MEGLDPHERLAQVMGFSHIDQKNCPAVECVIFVYVADFVSSNRTLARKADYAKMCVDEYVSSIERIPIHQFINPNIKLTMATDYHNRRGGDKGIMGGDAFVRKMKNAVESVQGLITEIPGACRSKDLLSGKPLKDMINKFIVGKWLDEQKVCGYINCNCITMWCPSYILFLLRQGEDKMQYVLIDDSIDKDKAYDDVPKGWWLKSPKTRALLALLAMRGSPEITGNPISSKPKKTRKETQEVEHAITLELRETAKGEHTALVRLSVDPNITNKIKHAEMEGIKGAVMEQKLNMFALHEVAYKAALGDNAYNNEVAGLLDEMMGSDNNYEVDASPMDKEERGRGTASRRG